jgi:hypothetical protein
MIEELLSVQSGSTGGFHGCVEVWLVSMFLRPSFVLQQHVEKTRCSLCGGIYVYSRAWKNLRFFTFRLEELKIF